MAGGLSRNGGTRVTTVPDRGILPAAQTPEGAAS
jgi:hypothetical protein